MVEKSNILVPDIDLPGFKYASYSKQRLVIHVVRHFKKLLHTLYTGATTEQH